jgi:general secretion pathway protein K
MAIMATAAAYMAEDELLAVRRVSNTAELEQAQQLVLGSEAWGLAVLARDQKANKTDHLNEDWNRLGAPVEVEQGSLATSIEDQQGRFNLNNLQAGRDAVWYPAFVRLLTVLGLEEGLADAVIDWIDGDQNISGASGAEDSDYLLRDPPYRSANRLIGEVSELRLIAGFDEERVAKLAPYVTALPAGDVRINVNTCAAPLLRVLGKVPLGEEAAESLAESRGDTGYQSDKDVLARPELAGQGDVAAKLIAVSSSYFIIASRARFDRVRLVMESLVTRSAEAGSARVLERRRGLL